MRPARNLMLLAIAAAVVMSTAPSASATQSIQVVKEINGVACDATCTKHFRGEVELGAIIFGFEVHEGDCLIEMDMTMLSNGTGTFTSFNEIEDVADTHDANCFHGPIFVGEDLPWTFSAEADSPGVIGLTTTVGIDPVESGECTGNLSMQIAEAGPEGNERYWPTFNNSRIGSSVCELTGSLEQERENIIHINWL